MHNYAVTVTIWDRAGKSETHQTSADGHLSGLLASWDGLKGRKSWCVQREIRCQFSTMVVRCFPQTRELEVHKLGPYGHPVSYYRADLIMDSRPPHPWQHIEAFGVEDNCTCMQLTRMNQWEMKPVGNKAKRGKRNRADSLDLYRCKKDRLEVKRIADMFGNMNVTDDLYDGYDDLLGYGVPEEELEDTMDADEFTELEPDDAPVYRIYDEDRHKYVE